MILPAFAAHLKFWGTNTAHPGTWSAFVINRSLIRMANVLQTTFWDAFYRKKSCDLIQILLKFDVKDPIDNKSVLVQVMAWCRQASSHCLNQCRHRFMTSYGVSLGCNELTPCCLGQGGVCDITDDNVLSILWQDSISFNDCLLHILQRYVYTLNLGSLKRRAYMHSSGWGKWSLKHSAYFDE